MSEDRLEAVVLMQAHRKRVTELAILGAIRKTLKSHYDRIQINPEIRIRIPD